MFCKVLATLLLPVLALPVLVDAIPLHPRSAPLKAANVNVGEQDPSLSSTSWPGLTTVSNDGIALIARGFFDIFRNPSTGSTPSTNNEVPPVHGDGRAANVAPEVERMKSTSLSSTSATSTAQDEPKSSVATLSAVDVARPSSDQPEVAKENGWQYMDWVRPRAIAPTASVTHPAKMSGQ